MPPVTSRSSPVIQRASSEARKATASAMSAGWPIRPSAVAPAVAAWTSGSRRKGVMSVSVGPGATAFTVIPRAPRALASAWLITLMAPFVIA
jgi:hypothetical protein